MRNKFLAIIVVSMTLAAAVAGATTATAAHGPVAKIKYFKTKISPSSNVTSGTVITTTSTGASKKTDYYCILSVTAPQAGGGSLTASKTSSLKTVKSNKKGKLTCKQTYTPWSAQDENGDTRHCPTTAADKRDGFKCSVAIADKATVGAMSASVAYFTAR